LSNFQRARLSMKQLMARLPEEGEPGRTSYRAAGEAVDAASSLPDEAGDELALISADSPTGSVLFVCGGVVMLVAPPFAVTEAIDFSEIHAKPLAELLERPRAYAVFLLRLGGFSVGFFRGAALVDSKTDQRFVKNRHRKGGQSQRRFERIREKQVDELFDKACETARETLSPYDAEIEHVFLGGDRGTVAAFRKECTYFEHYGERLMQRVLHVPGDPRRATLDSMPREVWSSDVWVWPGS
jgi:VLRF1 release factor-like protein